MKIVITHTNLSQGGGAETYLLNLVQGFCAAGDEVILVVGKRRGAIPLPAGCTVRQVASAWVPQKIRPWFLDTRFRRELRRVAHDHSISLARHSGHDLLINGGTHLGYLRATGRKPTWGDRLQVAVEKEAYATAGVVMPHSRLLGREIADLYGVPESRISVIYPPLDRARFRPSLRAQRGEFRRKYGLPADKRLVLFPSGGHERKGLPLLLAALEMLPAGACELVVVGRRAPRAGDRVPIHSLGYVAAIEELYAACDLTAMPSVYEPFGLVYAESVLCGTPALFPEQAGAAEVLAAPWGVCLRGRDPGELARLIGDSLARSGGGVQVPPIPEVATVGEHVEAVRGLLSKR